MLNYSNTLHFINRIDDSNCGDRIASPLLYYYEYFKKYRIKRHDIRFVDVDSIAAGDVVILGGGGMFDYAEFINRAINRVLDTGAAVIAWAPGFNTHTEYSESFKTTIDFERFAAIAVRDYANNCGLNYLPDVTCKLSGLKEKYPLCRKFGIAQHKDYPIDGFNYAKITNDREIEEILHFIGESEIIISNSFHMIYWAILMGKKVICVNPFSSKFSNFKYKPEYFHTNADNFTDCVNRAQNYDVLDECIKANDAFFERVKEIIENRLVQETDEWSKYDCATQVALINSKIRETQMRDGDLLASQLFIDTGSGFTEENKLVAINNVYGDELHSVRYDLSGYDEIKALRFDPIENQQCEVEIISAKSFTGDVRLNAQASVNVGNKDYFLTTDPQYYIDNPCTQYLEIMFKLRVLSSFDTAQNIYKYVWMQTAQLEQTKSDAEQQIALREKQIAQQALQIEQYKLDAEQ